MQVCGAFCSGYWALKMLRIFIAKKSVFLRKPHRLCKSTSGKSAMRI